MAEVAEAGVVADVLALGKEIVAINAALAQTPHKGNLVAAAEGVDLLPPQLIQGHDRRVIVAAENEIVLHQCRPLALLPVENEEEQHLQEARPADVPHLATHHRLVIHIVARRM